MPEPKQPERTPAQRAADHASLARLSETLVPALVSKLASSGLGELEVREGDWRIRLRRPAAHAAATSTRRAERPRLVAHAERDGRAVRDTKAASTAGLRGTPGDSPDGGGQPSSETVREVATSPAVGVFRPGAAVGTRVRAGDRIAIVDLLGIAQDVVAPIDGTLVEVFPQAGDPVEYGEEIAAVERDADPAPDKPVAAAEDGS